MSLIWFPVRAHVCIASQVGGRQEATNWYFSPSLSPSLPPLPKKWMGSSKPNVWNSIIHRKTYTLKNTIPQWGWKGSGFPSSLKSKFCCLEIAECYFQGHSGESMYIYSPFLELLATVLTTYLNCLCIVSPKDANAPSGRHSFKMRELSICPTTSSELGAFWGFPLKHILKHWPSLKSVLEFKAIREALEPRHRSKPVIKICAPVIVGLQPRLSP